MLECAQRSSLNAEAAFIFEENNPIACCEAAFNAPNGDGNMQTDRTAGPHAAARHSFEPWGRPYK